jgi:TolB protein
MNFMAPVLCLGCWVAADDAPLVRDAAPAAVRLTQSYHPKFFLSYSPDGSRLTFTRHYANRRAAQQVLMGLWIVDADGSNERRLLEAHDREVQIQEHAAWSPDGRRIAVTGGGNDTGNAAKDTFVCDVDAGSATGLRKLVPGAGVNVGEQPSWSPDGKTLVVTSTSATLWLIDADGKNRRKLTQQPGTYVMQPAWSPDGERIAFASDRDGNCELYTIRTDGNELVRVTNHRALDSHPKWSPDGQWIAFTSNRDGNNEVYVVRPDGSGLTNLTRHAAFDDHPAWHPDGRSMAFVSMRDGGFDVYRLTLPGEVAVASRPPTPQKPTSSPMVNKPDVASGLVAHFDFEADTGPTIRSKVGGLTATLRGPTRATGRVGRAIQFDGIDDVIEFGDPDALRLTGAISVELWVRPEAPPTAGEPLLIGKGTESWGLTYYTDGHVWFYISSGGNQIRAPIPTKQWSHLAATFDGKELRLYVNGQLKESRASQFATIVHNGVVRSGVDNLKNTHFAGLIDELRIYRRALTAEDVRAAFDAVK